MNSESPFRTSNMVLTFGCILCGIMAALFLIPRFGLFTSPSARSVVTLGLQHPSFSEFQTNGQVSVVDSLQPTVAPRPLPLPGSDMTNSASMPVVHSYVQVPPPDRVRQSTSTASRRNFVQSTSVERSVSQRPFQEDAVPHFYAPVTVHPVTVNIDNSGIVREISRVHERLDSLCNEVRLAEQFKPTHHDTVPSVPLSDDTVPSVPLPEPAERPLARRFEYRVHDDHSGKSSILKQVDQIQAPETVAETATEAESVPEPNPVPTRIATRPQKRNPTKPQTKPEAMSQTKPPILRHDTAAVDAEVTLVAPIEPLAETPEPIMSLPEPTPEFNIEIIPQQRIPDIPNIVLPAVEPQSEDPQILPALEFSTELMSIPDSTNGFDMTFENEETIEMVPRAASAEIERTVFCAPVIPYDRSELPKAGGTRVSFSGATKRTTDPPFMRGAGQQGAALSARIGKVPPGREESASHATRSMELHSAHPFCRNCGSSHQTHTPKYRIQAVTPSQTLEWIASMVW